MSYIVSSRGELIAKTESDFPSGMSVRYASERAEEALDANRDYNLVNARNGKISNAKKYDKAFNESETAGVATELNPGEFIVS